MDQFAPNSSQCDALTWLRMTAPVTQNSSCLQCAGQELSAFVLQLVSHNVQDAKLLELGQRLGEVGHVVLCPAAVVKPWSSSHRARRFGHDENDVDFYRGGLLSNRLQWGCDLVVCLILCTRILCSLLPSFNSGWSFMVSSKKLRNSPSVNITARPPMWALPYLHSDSWRMRAARARQIDTRKIPGCWTEPSPAPLPQTLSRSVPRCQS